MNVYSTIFKIYYISSVNITSKPRKFTKRKKIYTEKKCFYITLNRNGIHLRIFLIQNTPASIFDPHVRLKKNTASYQHKGN